MRLYEKVSEGNINRSVTLNFANCIDACSLVDLGFKGPCFTYQHGELKERLDRALGNIKWQDLFPSCSVINLPLPSSDHYALWIQPDPSKDRSKSHYFKFMAAWHEHPDFHSQVTNSWRVSDSWEANVSRFVDIIQGWNRDIFVNIFNMKRRILGRLNGIDNKLL